MTTLIGVVVLLGGLIFFHELGHYTVAKLFGVKVEVFSLGFGKKLFSKKIGDTEYCISLFPLGGYVKLMGDDPYKGVPAAESERAFSSQKLWKRFLVVGAGPISNLVLAYVLYLVVFSVGQPTPSSKIGSVNVGSPAWEAGVRPRDKIVEIGGTKMQTWNEMEEYLRTREGQKLDVVIERSGSNVTLPMTISRIRTKNVYGEDEEVGGIKGIAPNPLASMVGLSDPKSLGYAAGIRTADVITKIDGKPIALYDELNATLSEVWAPGKTIEIVVNRKADVESKDPGKEETFKLALPALNREKLTALGPAEVLGFYPSELFVKKVTPGSPAEKSGLQNGDRIVKVGDTLVYNFETLVDAVQELGAKEGTVNLAVQREGKDVPLTMKPIQTSYEDPITRQQVQRYMVGILPNTAYSMADYTKLKITDPVGLVKHAAAETKLVTERMVVSLGKLAMGKISMKNLGGPVLIASVAGKSLDAGIIPFIQMMALISINLFLINLFPVPILDGGHLLFFAIEGVKGKPVSIRTMEIANQVGMVFVLMLVGLTLFNDISRLVIN